jgi:hypothetical protein
MYYMHCSHSGNKGKPLFAGLFFSRLPKSYAGATAVLIDELDTGGFQCAANGQLVSYGE